MTPSISPVLETAVAVAAIASIAAVTAVTAVRSVPSVGPLAAVSERRLVRLSLWSAGCVRRGVASSELAAHADSGITVARR
jgi:hypothetical protein